MQTRHRIPTIFNLSLVDVLCCALGCVILLWLLNFREARRRAQAAGETAQQLKATRGQLALARQELDTLQKRHGNVLALLSRTRDRLDAETKKYANTLSTLHLAQSQLASLQETIKSLESKNAQAAAGLRAGAKERAVLARKLAESGLTLATLEKEIKDKKTELDTLNSQVKDLSGKLLASRTLIKQLRETEAELKEQVRDYRDRLAAMDARLLALSKASEKDRKALSDADRRILALLAERAALEKQMEASTKKADRRLVELLAEKALLEQKLSALRRDLAGAKVNLADLEAGNKALRAQIQKVRTAAENRFAGIELSGKKVVFLIDISGSMKMRDENTLSPTKWPNVCSTFDKLIRSLPDLTHYQVILFSNSVRYLHGHDGEWLPYDPKTSPSETGAALRKIDPHGGTKMSPAFAEVFRFRSKGLDTVYFFSDGLPNDDDDLPPEAAKLSEAQLTAYLSNRVRQLLKTVWNRPEPGRPAVRINTIGFFFDSPEVGAFLWALAREHDGGFVGMSRP
jgi:septal ring factor EnvC (AmiA/AmiB activator)